jgi:hypothetical protein
LSGNKTICQNAKGYVSRDSLTRFWYPFLFHWKYIKFAIGPDHINLSYY